MRADLKFIVDARSYRDVVLNTQAPMVDLYNTLVDALEKIDQDEYCVCIMCRRKCWRHANFYKMNIVLECAVRVNAVRWQHVRKMKDSRFSWQNTYYVLRERVHYYIRNAYRITLFECKCSYADDFCRTFRRTMGKCRDYDLDCYKLALANLARSMRGPFISELGVFMFLRAELNNDVALYIFDFL